MTWNTVKVHLRERGIQSGRYTLDGDAGQANPNALIGMLRFLQALDYPALERPEWIKPASMPHYLPSRRRYRRH
jgi:hypothetical protein